MDDYGSPIEGEDKAGYNTAADIAQVLGNLRKTYIAAMISSPEDFKLALNTCRRVIDVISAKVPEKEIEPERITWDTCISRYGTKQLQFSPGVNEPLLGI